MSVGVGELAQRHFFGSAEEAEAFYRDQRLEPPWFIIRGFEMARDLEIPYPSQKPIEICLIDNEEALASLYGEFVIPVAAAKPANL